MNTKGDSRWPVLVFLSGVAKNTAMDSIHKKEARLTTTVIKFDEFMMGNRRFSKGAIIEIGVGGTFEVLDIAGLIGEQVFIRR